MWILLIACASSAPPAATTPATPAATPVASEPVPAACLQKADAYDGAEDKVVHRCPNCTLVMDGDPAYTSTIDGYTIHSCSEACKHAIDTKPALVMERACKKIK
jgi:hypothetical protein